MVQLTDNSQTVKKAIADAVRAFLHEAAGEIVSQTQKNVRVDTGQTKGSYQYRIVEGQDEQKAIIGSDYMNAVWEEFGTGEYALHGGRKGGWWIKVGNGAGEIPLKAAKKYRWAGYRFANGSKSFGEDPSGGTITYVFTYGKKPNKPMRRAYEKLRDPIKEQLVSRFGAEMG